MLTDAQIAHRVPGYALRKVLVAEYLQGATEAELAVLHGPVASAALQRVLAAAVSASMSGPPVVRAVPNDPQVDGSRVYYVQRHDLAIKIGYSTCLPSRLRSIARQHGDLVLLASELGGWDREQAQHRRFCRTRLSPQGEWFGPSPGLLSYIKELTCTA